MKLYPNVFKYIIVQDIVLFYKNWTGDVVSQLTSDS